MSTEALVEKLQKAIDAKRLWKHVEWASHVRRDTGGPGEEKMVKYIIDELAQDEVPVKIHTFDAYLSYPRQATLEVRPEGEEAFQLTCLTHSFARSTGPNGLIGRAKIIGEGDLDLAAGRVAVVDGVATPIQVLDLDRAGAQAIIFVNPGPVIHHMIETTIWGGIPTPSQVDRLPGIPVVSVNNPDGERLKALLRKGPVEVKLVTKVDTGWYTVKLPEVVIPGTDDSADFILVGGHYCSWEVGITDNATGVAVLLELARILWQERNHLKRSVRIAWWPGHSHGRYAGSTWYADTFFTELRKHCILYHNIDSPGARGATQYILRHTSAEVEDFARRIVQTYTGQQDPPVHRPTRAADQSFLNMGIPSCSLYSFLPDGHPDKRLWTGGSASGWWWHTEFDTLDKADPAILEKDCRLSAAFITLLANTEVLPFDFKLLAAEIAETIKYLEQEIGTEVDLRSLVELAEELVQAAEDLSRKPVAVDPAKVARRNYVLRKISQSLNPVVFGLEGPYGHDVAERVPQMTAHKGAKMDGLSRGLELKYLRGTDRYGFLKVQTVRQINRATEALEGALELLRSELQQ